MSPTTRARMRRRYDRWAPIIALTIGVIGVAGILVGAFAMVANGRQDAQRDADVATLLECFDTYAAATSTSSRAVRVAAVEKDEAAAAHQVALNVEGREFLRFVRKLAAGTVDGVEDIRPLQESLEVRAQTGRVLERKQTKLDEVREANPIPEPPSVVCEEETEDVNR